MEMGGLRQYIQQVRQMMAIQFTLFHTVKKTTLAQKIKKNMLILNQLRSVTFQ